jgi:hypothetical protein
MHLLIQIPYCNWNGQEGHWETGGAGDKKWADYVIYSGSKKTFSFAAMQEAVIGLAVFTGTPAAIKTDTAGKYLELSAKGLTVKALKKPDDEFRIKNDFDTDSK